MLIRTMCVWLSWLWSLTETAQERPVPIQRHSLQLSKEQTMACPGTDPEHDLKYHKQEGDSRQGHALCSLSIHPEYTAESYMTNNGVWITILVLSWTASPKSLNKQFILLCWSWIFFINFLYRFLYYLIFYTILK